MNQIRSYIIVIGIVAGLIGGLGLYVKGRSDASYRTHISNLTSQVEALKNQERVLNTALKSDQEQAAKDNLTLLTYQERVDELLSQTKNADSICADAADTQRLHDSFKAIEGGAKRSTS